MLQGYFNPDHLILGDPLRDLFSFWKLEIVRDKKEWIFYEKYEDIKICKR